MERDCSASPTDLALLHRLGVSWLERIVIPAGDTGIHLVFSKSDFVITKLRLAQQFEKDFECIIEGILQAVPTYG